MSKESILRDFATKPCGHIDWKCLGVARDVTDKLAFDEEYQLFVEEIVPSAVDGLEDETEEEKRAHLAIEWLDYLWYPKGEEDIVPCSECDQEKLRLWIESTLSW